MGDFKCRPLGFLLGLPFALLALIVSLPGAVIWIIGYVVRTWCPCCWFCVGQGLIDLAVALMKLPLKILKWFTEQIPC